MHKSGGCIALGHKQRTHPMLWLTRLPFLGPAGIVNSWATAVRVPFKALHVIRLAHDAQGNLTAGAFMPRRRGLPPCLANTAFMRYECSPDPLHGCYQDNLQTLCCWYKSQMTSLHAATEVNFAGKPTLKHASLAVMSCMNTQAARLATGWTCIWQSQNLRLKRTCLLFIASSAEC